MKEGEIMIDIDNPIGKQINRTARDIKKFLYYHLDEYSLGDGQFGILYDISKNQGVSQDQISKSRNVDKATIAKAIKKLIENDYIYRERDKSDKRAYCLYCTEKGIRFIPEIERIVILENTVATKGLNNEEIDLLSSLLEKVSININEYFDEEVK